MASHSQSMEDFDLLQNGQNVVDSIAASLESVHIEREVTDTATSNTSSVQELEILMVGKTGTGKSSSGNSILGQELFVASDSAESVTSKTTVQWGKRGNYNIKVVDTPGMFGTEFSNDPKKSVEYAVDKFSESFYHCPNGFHALVLVLRYPIRMTAEEIEAVEQLRKIFGGDFIKNHCVLIVTNGEGFDLEAKKRKYDSFEKWCEEQDRTFGYLVAECGNRIVLFYNLCGDDRKTRAVEKFISLVENIGNRYTNDEFNRWKHSRDVLIVRTGLVQLKENIEPRISVLVNKLVAIRTMQSPEDMLEKLKMLKVEVQELKTEIDNEDRETDVLKSLKMIVKNLDNTIDGIVATLTQAHKEHRMKIIDISPLLVLLAHLIELQEQGKKEIENLKNEQTKSKGKGFCGVS